MNVTTISKNLFGAAGPQLEATSSGQDFVIAAHVTVMGAWDPANIFEASPAILLAHDNHDLTVHGSVIGDIAVQLGDNAGTDFGNRLVVSEMGSLVGTASGATIYGGGSVLNEGTIRGSFLNGFAQHLETNASTEIVNKGLIVGASYGIDVDGGAATSVKLVNSGTLIGKNWGAYYGVTGKDTVVNTGVIEGHVVLGDGDDFFDNREGQIVMGEVKGGAGHDTFLPGLGTEVMDGGNGYDTLDFRSGAGLKVSLTDNLGTGRAQGDVYMNIERVLGSSTGADTLLGSNANNTLVGSGGNDKLYGGNGADRLEGGAGGDTLSGGSGKDNLYGGTGNDSFALLPGGGDADVIHDWGQVDGNNDRFLVDASVFGGGLAAGSGLGTLFVSRANSNEAIEAVDRFIFRQSDETLWFDKDGKGGAAGVQIADLQDGATVGAWDFLLVA